MTFLLHYAILFSLDRFKGYLFSLKQHDKILSISRQKLANFPNPSPQPPPSFPHPISIPLLATWMDAGNSDVFVLNFLQTHGRVYLPPLSGFVSDSGANAAGEYKAWRRREGRPSYVNAEDGHMETRKLKGQRQFEL